MRFGIVAGLVVLVGVALTAAILHFKPSEENAGPGAPPPVAPTGKPTLFAGTEAGYHPFAFIDSETRRIEGFDVELARTLGERAGFHVEFRNLRFDDILPELERGGLDLAAAALTITPERRERFLFTDSYHESSQVIVRRAADTGIVGIASLSEKNVAVQQGTTCQELAEKHLGVENQRLFRLDKLDDMFEGLLASRFDVVIVDRPVAERFGRTNTGLVIVEPPLMEEEYGLAFPRARNAEFTRFNQALRDIKKSGRLGELQRKWFPEDQSR